MKIMSQQRDYRAEITLKAMKDEDFRQKLLDNPKAVMEHELGIVIPDKINIQVLEEKHDNFYLVLPPKASSEQELTDDELDSVAGGNHSFWYYVNRFMTALGDGH